MRKAGRVGRVGAVGAAALLLAGCQGGAAPLNEPDPTGPTLLSLGELPANAPPVDLALHRVPMDAETFTLTDWDVIRLRFGTPDLTTADPKSDRNAFWERTRTDAAALTDGLLSDSTSTLELDHGFGRDDVDWEARWTGEGGSGWIVAFRPDLDMSRVRDAVEAGVGPLAGEDVEVDDHLVFSGAGEGDDVWAMDPDLGDLVENQAESMYLHRGCIPPTEALGPGAGSEQQDALQQEVDPTDLEPLESFGVTFHEESATAWLGKDRLDLSDRTDLTEDWPAAVEGPSFGDVFTGEPTHDPSTGRIGFDVRSLPAAVRLTLTHTLPFAICNDKVFVEEPTGL